MNVFLLKSNFSTRTNHTNQQAIEIKIFTTKLHTIVRIHAYVSPLVMVLVNAVIHVRRHRYSNINTRW